MRKSALFWGAILVIVGGLLLLQNLGILTVNVWNLIWPIGLILLGVWVLIGVFSGSRPMKTESVSIPLEGVTRATITLHHGAGRLSIHDHDAADLLLDGSFTGGVEHKKSIIAGQMMLDLRPPSTSSDFWGRPWNWSNRGYEWSITLKRGVPLALRLETGAAEAQVNLANLQVTDLSVATGASSSDITLPANAGFTRVRLEAGAASLNVHIPGGVAARIHTQSGLSSISIDQTRFPRNGNIYVSPDYEKAINQLDIDVQMGVGSVSIS